MAVATQVEFSVTGGPFPAFGPRYTDVTRPGDSTLRFMYDGLAGERAKISARRYFARSEDAVTFSQQLRNLQGRIVRIRDRLNERYCTGMLHSVTFEHLKRVESSDGNDWAVIAYLDFQRTA